MDLEEEGERDLLGKFDGWVFLDRVILLQCFPLMRTASWMKQYPGMDYERREGERKMDDSHSLGKSDGWFLLPGFTFESWAKV
jgi:hypothetical protein